MCISSNQFCLEDNTERSESNPGRSLGIYKAGGTAVWKTVPPHKRSIRYIRLIRVRFTSEFFVEHGFISKFAEECDAVA